MTSKSFCLPSASAVALALSAGCSPKTDNVGAPMGGARNVTLTADRRRHIRLYTVTDASYHKVVEAPAVVNFDNDQATASSTGVVENNARSQGLGLGPCRLSAACSPAC
jgi:hypothetical protein